MNKGVSLVEQHGIGPSKTNLFGDRYFYNINRSAFEKHSAYALFDARFAGGLFNEDSLNVVIGTDSGLLPRYILKRGLPNGARYIFIEPAGVLEQLVAAEALDGLDSRIACISLERWEETVVKFKIVDYFYIGAVQSFNAICAQDDNINEYAELSWHVTEVLSQLHWQTNMVLGCEAFLTRQIENVVDNRLPAKLLANAFKHKTVVLLAGGPSLDEALPWLLHNRSHVAVFAVSRISRRLQQVGIEPDFIFSVDPTDLSFDISKEMLSFSEHPIFIYSYHTVPTLVSQWHGLAFYLGARLPWKSDLNEDNFDGSGPTVTNTALNVAHHMGFKQVILAGVDLCFTRQGYTHAQGSNEHSVGPRFDLTSLQLETNGGFMAPTSCDFAQAVNALVMQAKLISSLGCRIINISENAAKIEHIDFVPLSQLQIASETLDVKAVVSAKMAEYKLERDYLNKLEDELTRSRFQIQAIQQLAEDARHLNDEMYDGDGIIRDYKDKKKLDRIEKQLRRNYRHYNNVVKKFGIRRFIKLAKPFTDEEWSAEDAKKLGNVYYDAYAEGTTKLLSLLDDAIDRLLARRQEESTSPRFEKLLERARKDRNFGRGRLWRKRFSISALSAETVAALDEFERRFSEILGDRNTSHLARAKSHSNLAYVKQRAGLLFKHKKHGELNNLLQALEKHEDQSSVLPYRHLVNGYLSELMGDTERALDAYQSVIDLGEILLEEALTRIAGIAITRDDIHTANLALQCLSQLNPLYLPFYAEIQRLHGDAFQAIEIYTSYIEQFPSDTLVQVKLAMLYMDYKIYDGAELMLDYILRQQPDFDVALNLKQRLATEKAAE